MSKLKIEHGASKIDWVLLKTNIEESISNDIDLMCQWSNNDRKYVVNELLRFALTQSEEFQKYKEEQAAKHNQNAKDAKPVVPPARPQHETNTKPAVLVPSAGNRQ